MGTTHTPLGKRLAKGVTPTSTARNDGSGFLAAGFAATLSRKHISSNSVPNICVSMTSCSEAMISNFPVFERYAIPFSREMISRFRGKCNPVFEDHTIPGNQPHTITG